MAFQGTCLRAPFLVEHFLPALVGRFTWVGAHPPYGEMTSPFSLLGRLARIRFRWCARCSGYLRLLALHCFRFRLAAEAAQRFQPDKRRGPVPVVITSLRLSFR